MSTKQKLFGFYLGLPARQRIHHLMRNYHCRDYYEEGYRKYIEGVIADIRSYERNRKADIGVRIMSGGSISDITASKAEEAVRISKAFTSGQINESLIKDIEDRRMISLAVNEWMTIREDYGSLNRVLWLLQPEDHDLIMDYLNKKKDYYDIADEYSIEFESAKKKLQRIRGRVVKMALPDFTRHGSGRLLIC